MDKIKLHWLIATIVLYKISRGVYILHWLGGKRSGNHRQGLPVAGHGRVKFKSLTPGQRVNVVIDRDRGNQSMTAQHWCENPQVHFGACENARKLPKNSKIDTMNVQFRTSSIGVVRSAVAVSTLPVALNEP
ncbi:hypothetical protein PM082_021858, partial [Marasmius tenuissimus]